VKQTDVLIIGTSAAGATAAITVRRHYPEVSMIAVRKEEHTPVPCGIPYILTTVGSCEKNLMSDDVFVKNNVELLIGEVTALDLAAHTATLVPNGSGESETIQYRKLILGTGSSPIVPPIPGVDLPGVYMACKDPVYLNNVLSAVHAARRLVFVGGGLVGLELAEEARKRGLETAVVELLPHPLELVFDEDLILRAERELVRLGIAMHTGRKVTAIEGKGKVESVLLDDGSRLPADLVMLAIGVTPNIALAQAAGLAADPRRGIAVDRFMRTSHPDVFAAGDCASKVSYFTGLPTNVKLASVAAAEARVAAANLFEVRRQYPGVVGVYSTKIGELAMGLVGLGEKAASSIGIPYIAGYAEAADHHPASMPGTKTLGAKLIFARDTARLIGGQVCCSDSTGEIVNIISTMVQQGMTAEDIATTQIGTHPALNASPVAYQLINAAEMALVSLRKAH